jgi:hypothetical protein
MKTILMSVLLICSFEANAVEWVEVEDASKLLWQMTDSGIVFFRNLNEFNSNHGGCCYAYKLDTTTPGGKTIWSTILAKMAAHKRITLGFSGIGSNESVQTLNYIGRHYHASNE